MYHNDAPSNKHQIMRLAISIYFLTLTVEERCVFYLKFIFKVWVYVRADISNKILILSEKMCIHFCKEFFLD